MREKTKDNLKLIVGVILLLAIIILITSIIKDLLIIIFKDSLNKIVLQIIYFLLVFFSVWALSKTSPVKQMEEEILSKIKKTKS